MVAAIETNYPTNGKIDNRYRLGTWVLLAAVVMLFTSLSSAYIVRIAASNDWQPLPMPRVLFLSTLLIVISSLTFAASKRNLSAGSTRGYVRLLSLTLIIGFAFLTTQLIAWRELSSQGVYLASHSHSSFFYLLTATHGVHLLGGLLVMIYLIYRSRTASAEEISVARHLAITDAATLYWHFMGGLWIYIFLLLFFWR